MVYSKALELVAPGATSEVSPRPAARARGAVAAQVRPANSLCAWSVARACVQIKVRILGTFIKWTRIPSATAEFAKGCNMVLAAEEG